MDASDHIDPLARPKGLLEAVELRSANKLILTALLSIGSANLLIRVMGMGMQVVATSRFGGGATMDAYFVSTTLPLTIATIALSAIQSSAVPVYTRTRSQRGRQAASQLFSTLLTMLIGAMVVLTFGMVVFRRQLVFLTAPTLDPFRAGYAVYLSLFSFPAVLILVVLAFLESALNSEGQFGWPAYAGMLVPCSMGFLALFLGSSLGVVALSVGMLVGLVLQAGVFSLRLRRAGIVFRPSLNLRHPELVGLVSVAWPALLAASVGQASPLIDQIFASSLTAGSISALSYALKLVSVPVGVLFVAVSRAAVPYLSRQKAIGDMRAFKATLRLYLWLIGIASLLISAVMLVLAHPIVHILFQRGAFTPAEANLTAYTLDGFMVGMVPMALGFLLAMSFSALGKTRVLLLTSSFSVIANAVFDAIFSHFWQSFGIALATSMVYFCTFFILIILLRHNIGKLNLFASPSSVLQGFQTGSTLRLGHAGLGDLSGSVAPRSNSGWHLDFTEPVGRVLVYIGAVVAAGVVGFMVSLVDALTALRVVIGVPFMVIALRYRYVLILMWSTLDVFIGSSIQLFNGNNLDTALTVPTLLSLFVIPLGQSLKRMPAVGVLLVFLFWVLAGIRISPLDTVSFLKLWTTYLDFGAVALIIVAVVSTRRRLLGVIDIILIVAAFVALFGIYGYFTHHNVLFDTTTGRDRITSIMDSAPPLALYLSTNLPLAIYRVFTLRGKIRILALPVIPILVLALLLTFTRAVFISLPLCFITAALFLPASRVKIGVIFGTMVLVALTILLGAVGNVPIFARFLNGDIGTLNGRTYLWSALLYNFHPSQLLGYGLGASDVFLTKLHIGTNGEIGNGLIANSPSNLYIGTLYDHGIIGLALLLLMFLVLGIQLIRGIRVATGGRRLLFAMALTVLINMLVQSIDVNDFWTQAIGIYFWILMALPFASCWFSSSNTKDSGLTTQENYEETLAQPEAVVLGG